MSREFTEEEVREKFLNHVRGLIKYWDKVDDRTTEEKLEGLAFSMMSAIDGCAMSLPKFILAPDPHSEDKDYYISKGENYYPDAPDVPCDISGCLHEKI